MVQRTVRWGAVLLVAVGLGVVAASAPAQAAPVGAAISSDYNGDGFGDLAIGEQRRTVNGVAEAGAVHIISNLNSALPAAGSTFISEDTAGVPGVVSGAGWFGNEVASGNFDGDQYADLAIGAPAKNSHTGEVVVLYGSASGLHGTAQAQAKAELLQAGQFVPTGGARSDFGGALATADFNVDGYADLAIGASSTPGGGGIVILYGGPSGLLPSSNFQWIDQGTTGVPGTGGATDQFGQTLAAGDFNGDGRADLGVGVPGKTVSGVAGAGEIVALLSDASGHLSGTGALAFDQDSPGMPDTAELNDLFGGRIAAGDLTGDGKAELIASSSNEPCGGQFLCGIVIVLKGSATGPTTTGVQSFLGNANDGIGISLAVVNANGDPYKELAIGSLRTVNGLSLAGLVWVLPGTASGPTTVGAQTWTQDSTNVLDQVEAGDWFGYSLKAVENSTGRTQNLAIGVVFETLSSCTHCGAVALLKGSAGGLVATGNLLIGGDSLIGGGFADGDFANDLG